MKNIDRYAALLSISIGLEPLATPKPGNVHRCRDLPGLRLENFTAASIISYRYFRRGLLRGIRGKAAVGDLIYGIVRETYDLTNGSNPSLGSSLLLGVLSLGIGCNLRQGKLSIEDTVNCSSRMLRSTGVRDTIYFYRAVRLITPKYLSPRDETGRYVNIYAWNYRRQIKDKRQTLWETLEFAADRDIVSRETVSGYKYSIEALRHLEERLQSHGDWNRSVVETYLYILSRKHDTLVSRLMGEETAEYTRLRAAETYEKIISGEGWPQEAWMLDDDLRRKGVNPGSIADIAVSTIALYLIRHKTIPLGYKEKYPDPYHRDSICG